MATSQANVELRTTPEFGAYVVLGVLELAAGLDDESLETGFDSAGLDSVDGLASAAGADAPSDAGLPSVLEEGLDA